MKSFLIVSTLFLLGSLASAKDAGTHEKHLAQMLFPESITWTDVETAPSFSLDASFTADRLQKDLKPLVAAGFANLAADCEIGKKILDTQRDSFKSVDVNGDGLADVIYSGPSLCSESEITLVWLNEKGAYRFASAPAFSRSGSTIKLKPGSKPSVVGVNVGCCDMQEDVYYILDDSGRREITVFKATEIPSELLKSPKSVAAKKEIILRSTPKIRDEFDNDQSHHLETAVFGNILSKYLPGAKVQELADRNVNGKRWVFVVVDNGSNFLRHDSITPANAGWVLGSQLP